MCELWSMLDHSQDRKIHFTLEETMKYKVRWIESYEYEREVEADSREDAINKATSNCGTEEDFTG